MNKSLSRLICLALIAVHCRVSCFVPTSSTVTNNECNFQGYRQRRCPGNKSKLQKISNRNLLHCRHQTPKSSSSRINQQQSNDIVCLSFEGVVADTVEWRTRLGIDGAIATFPHLRDLLLQYSDNEGDRLTEYYRISDDDNIYNNEGNDSWLLNKMRALSHVLTPRPGSSLTSEYALLARLLIEEQQLDQGQSVGKKGKYAKQFHPRGMAKQPQQVDQETGGGGGSRSSRPLTVGEIDANWNGGGCLSDSLLVKYNIDGKMPLPIIEKKIQDIVSSSSEEKSIQPKINPIICQSLSNTENNIVFITLGHQSDLSAAQRILDENKLDYNTKIITSLKDAVTTFPSTSSRITLLVPSGSSSNNQISETNIIQQLVCKAKDDSVVHVVNSNYESLEKLKHLFGDNMPRQGKPCMIAAGGESKNVCMTLNFSKFAQNTSPTQHNDAVMNPWMNLLKKEKDLADLLEPDMIYFQ